MQEASLEKEYTAHSTRHASTSKVLSNVLDLTVIKHAEGGSKDSRVFAQFYNRRVKNSEGCFVETVFS